MPESWKPEVNSVKLKARQERRKMSSRVEVSDSSIRLVYERGRRPERSLADWDHLAVNNVEDLAQPLA